MPCLISEFRTSELYEGDVMNKGIYPALSGGVAYEKLLTIIANNVANVNTAGYKADRPVFKVDMPDSIYQSQDPPSPLSDKFYTEIDSVFTDFNSGVIRQTGNVLDLAIEGDGFFVIDTPDGTRYARSGNFILDASKTLTTVDGHMVMGDGGPIILEEGKIAVDADGRVSVNGSEVNKVKIVDFEKPYTLTKDQNNMFFGAGEQTAGGYKLLQGAVELSNVNSVKEMAAMISVLRGYESYQKVMTTMDETSAKANEVGRV